MSVSKVYKALLDVESTVKNSGASTWCDHIPEWQMLITPILKYELNQNDLSHSKKYLQESLKYYEAVKKYFNGYKPIQDNLEILLKIINTEIKNKDIKNKV